MRILVLNFEYPPLGGGASPVCHEINTRYVRAGHHVSVVTMAYKGLSSFEIIDGIEVYRVPCWRRHVHISRPYEQLTYLINAWIFLKSFLKTKSFDTCHAHFLLPTGILCRRLKKKFGIPYIITSHGSDIPRFNPDRFKFLHLWTPPMIRSIAKASVAITSPSHYLAKLILKVTGDDGHDVVIIPNGIDAAQYYSGTKNNTIISAGRLLPRKGFRDLILAVKDIVLPMKIHILGDGPLKHELERLASASKTPVILHGWVDNRSKEYKEWFAEASIYCLVSLRENASISILEAMASGCAVITSDQSGCPEMVEDAGILVPHGKPEEIKKAIVLLCDDHELRNSLGQKAMERVHRYYNWDVIANQYLQLLERSLMKSHA